jgi:hypothetical protein
MLTVVAPAGYPHCAARCVPVDVFFRVGYCDGMMPRIVLIVLGTVLLVSTHLRAQPAADSDVTISTDRPAVHAAVGLSDAAPRSFFGNGYSFLYFPR